MSRDGSEGATTVATGEPDLDLVPTLPGQRLGRYVVLERAGVGGMAEVFRAYDPKLGREVALKRLTRAGRGAQRIVREAQAMARLSHPNVLPVYDVEQDDRQTFIAMEYVDGQTLAQWLEEARRPWAEVVHVMRAAGEGLAAAHRAGVVHRDFKPHNVMVGRDGRVRVMDFGLARGYDTDVSGEDAHDEPTVSGELETLTEAGTVMGTPAYMSPEQHTGDPVDALSDQYSFCVTLFEGVYGRRPFDAPFEQVLGQKLAGPKVPGDATAPSWLRAVIERGLAPKPGNRFGSMRALLKVLRRRPTQTRRRVVVGLALAGSAGVAGWALEARTEATTLCQGARDHLAGVWDEPSRTAVRGALEGRELSYAASTAQRVMQRLDTYAEDWVAAHTEACAATTIRGEQSSGVMDLRMACLSDRRRELQALVGVLADADDEMVRRAARAAASLTAVTSCADLRALEARVTPPADPETAAQVDAVREQIAEAFALQKAGRYEAGLIVAKAALEQAERTGYRAAIAAAAHRAGALRARVGPEDGRALLEQAYFEARWSRDDPLAARIARELVTAHGVDASDPKAADRWAKLGRADLGESGERGEGHGLLLIAIGSAAHAQARYPEALEHFQQGLEILDAIYEANDPGRATALYNIGLTHAELGQYAEALEAYDGASAIEAEVLGADHPHYAATLHGMGVVYAKLGRADDALEHYRRALGIFERALGPNAKQVGAAWANIAGVQAGHGRYRDALDSSTKALRIFESATGPDHPLAGQSHDNIGAIHWYLGEYEEAVTEHRTAIEILERAIGPRHPDVANAYTNLAASLDALGRYDEALKHHEYALDVRREALGDAHPEVAASLESMGAVYDVLMRHDEAVVNFQQASEIFEAALGEHNVEVAEAKLNLAMMLAQLERFDEANEQARRGFALYVELLRADHPDLAKAHLNMSFVQRLGGQPEAALEHLTKAQKILDRAADARPDVRARVAGDTGLTLLALGRPQDAIEPLERAVDLRDAGPGHALEGAESRYLLGVALIRSGRDRSKGELLKNQGREQLLQGPLGSRHVKVADAQAATAK